MGKKYILLLFSCGVCGCVIHAHDLCTHTLWLAESIICFCLSVFTLFLLFWLSQLTSRLPSLSPTLGDLNSGTHVCTASVLTYYNISLTYYSFLKVTNSLKHRENRRT